MVREPYSSKNPLLNRKNATYKPFIDRAEKSGVELFFTECSSVVESSHDAKPERDLAKVERDLASAAWTDIIWCGKTPIQCARDLGLLVPEGDGVALAGVPLNAPQRSNGRTHWPVAAAGSSIPARAPTTPCLTFSNYSALVRRCVPAFSVRIGAQTALCNFQSRRWHITEQYFATLQTPQRSVASLLQVDDEQTPSTRGAGAGGGASSGVARR